MKKIIYIRNSVSTKDKIYNSQKSQVLALIQKFFKTKRDDMYILVKLILFLTFSFCAVQALKAKAKNNQIDMIFNLMQEIIFLILFLGVR